MLHKPFILRQLTRSRKQATVFVLCVVLSIVTLIALNGFSMSVHDSLLKDARTLHGGDIIIRSHSPLSKPLKDAVASLAKRGLVESARYYELFSVVRTAGDASSLLAILKIVEKPYPFYGNLQLQSGRAFHEVLTRGSVIVEQGLLDRLHVRVGDSLGIGSAALTIRDVVEAEPDRPVNFFSLGPRVFISTEDLEGLDLVKAGSRIEFVDLLKVHDPKKLDRITGELKAVAEKAAQERVDTFMTESSGVKKFMDNFLFFLSLIGIFTLLLAGFGIQSALAAFLKEKEKTIAIMKTVGATSRFIMAQFVAVLCVLGLMGTIAGLGLGFLLQHFLPALFKELLPQNVHLIVSWRAVLQGLLLGVFVVALFAFLPVYRLRDLKPGAIFRKEDPRIERSLPYLLTISTILLFFIGMVLWQLQDLKVGLWFVAAVAGLIAAVAVITQLVLFFLVKSRVKALAMRQALKGLFRPRNATRAIIITLTASLSVIFSITLIEGNLDAAFVSSYPPEAPNVFFIDIQPGQLEDFSRALGIKTRYHPIVRGRVTSINDEPVDPDKEREKRGDNLSREFNLTYREELLEDETIIEGKSLFRNDWHEPQVSVMDTVVKMKPLRVGDRIVFKIQGIPLYARVSSIRSRTGEHIQPFFYFVFQTEILKDAPQAVFTAVRMDKEAISPLQNRIASRFPNVSIVDVTQTIAVFSKVMHKLSRITRFFTSFSIIAGILILVSSIFATRFARVQEAVYFKILGARRVFVLKVFTLENTLLGLISAVLALLVAQTGSWIVCARVLDVPYRPFIGTSSLMVAATLLLVILAGLLSSRSILNRKPAAFLREQTEE